MPPTAKAIAQLPLEDQLRHLRTVLSTNTTLLTVLTRAAALGLPNWYLAAGALSQTIWNFASGLPPETGIHDYDLVYFDPDLSYSAEDAFIQRGKPLFADIPQEVEIRNQARVHLWYPQKFGGDRFVDCHERHDRGAGAARRGVEGVCPEGVIRVFFGMVVRPNTRIGLRDAYEKKARRWLGIWEGLKIMPWPENEEPLKFEKE